MQEGMNLITDETRRSEYIMLKVSKSEKEAIRQNSVKYAGGNVSLWLRHAGMNHEFTGEANEEARGQMLDQRSSTHGGS